MDAGAEFCKRGCGCASTGDEGAKGGAGELLHAAGEVLRRCARVVELASPQAYQGESAVFQGACIAAHMHHVIQFFEAVLAARGVVDYQFVTVEAPESLSREEHAARIERAARGVRELRAEDLGKPVDVYQIAATCGEMVAMRSTLGRELALATHHALHHQSIMRVIAGEFGVALPEDFGGAPVAQQPLRERIARTGAVRTGGVGGSVGGTR